MIEKFAVVAIRAERDDAHPGREKAFIVVDSMNNIAQAENYIEAKRHQHPQDMAFEIMPAISAQAYVVEVNAPPAVDDVIENR